MIKNYEIDENFWNCHPELKTREFLDFYKGDNSKGKSRSSIIMWCIAMIFDDESKYYNLLMEGENGKASIVFGSFMNNENYYQENRELVDGLGKYYEILCSTPAKRHLKAIENLLDNRTQYLQDNKYTTLPSVKDAVDLDKLVMSTDKITETYENAVKRLAKEKNTKTKGNTKKSLGDSEAI